MGSALAGLEYRHPFCNRMGEAFPAGFVTSDTGTGFVHIAPGHGLDDYTLVAKIVCRFTRQWTTTAASLTRMICLSSNRCGRDDWQIYS